MILSFNTSTPQFSMALMYPNGAVLAETIISSGSKNFISFMPTFDSLLSTSKVQIQDIKALVIAIGPGSFTGLRVGLSAAKGVCQGLEIPIIGVSGLEAMAGQLPYAACPVCPLIRSRKGEIFTALFQGAEGHNFTRLKGDTALRFEELPSFIEEKTLFVGNDFEDQAHRVHDILGQKAVLAPSSLWQLRASSLGSVGLKRYKKNEYDDLRDLVPSYLRAPDIRPSPFPLPGKEPNCVDK